MNVFTMTNYTLMKDKRGQLLLSAMCGMLHTVLIQNINYIHISKVFMLVLQRMEKVEVHGSLPRMS
jgi:hypothetical protein